MQKGFSKILITVIILIVIAGGLLAWQQMQKPEEGQPLPQTFSCQKNEDCVLTYTGMESCAPCDYADESFQCVSPEEAERLEQERIEKHGHMLCDMCPPSPLLFRCVCQDNICFKTANCQEDSDCYSRTFEEQYKCKDGQCTFVGYSGREDEATEWKTYQNKEFGFEMKYPGNWDYLALELSPNPIIFAPQEIVVAVKESLDNIEGDKTLSLTITFYDRLVFEGGILPYRGESTEYIERTSSEVEVGEARGVYYISEYVKDKGSYKTGEKTVTVDLPIEDGYLSIHLFDEQYLAVLEQMLATFRFLD